MKTSLKIALLVNLGVMLLSTGVLPAKAQTNPVEILTGVRLVNVEKVDVAAKS